MSNNSGEENKKPNKRLYFFFIVLFIYLIIYLNDSVFAQRAVNASLKILINVIPILLFVIVLMGIINFFLNKKTVSKYLGKDAGLKGWLFSITGGILSHGTVFAWYPMLMELKEQGMESKFAVLFLYTRAIKIPLLPVMVYYFGLLYSILFIVLILISALIQAKIIEVLKV